MSLYVIGQNYIFFFMPKIIRTLSKDHDNLNFVKLTLMTGFVV